MKKMIYLILFVLMAVVVTAYRPYGSGLYGKDSAYGNIPDVIQLEPGTGGIAGGGFQTCNEFSQVYGVCYTFNEVDYTCELGCPDNFFCNNNLLCEEDLTQFTLNTTIFTNLGQLFNNIFSPSFDFTVEPQKELEINFSDVKVKINIFAIFLIFLIFLLLWYSGVLQSIIELGIMGWIIGLIVTIAMYLLFKTI